MKKIVSLALACMLLLSCFAINAFAADKPALVYTASEITDGKFTVDVTSTEDAVTVVYGVLGYDATKVALLNADGTEVTTAATKNAYTATAGEGSFEGSAAKWTSGELAFSSKAISEDGIAVGDTIITLHFKALGDITENPFKAVDSTSANWTGGWKISTRLYAGVGIGVKSGSTYYGNKDAATLTIDADAIIADDPIVVDGPLNDEGVDNSVASTLTFYGRIGAEWFGEDYGIIIEGKDFFGAQPGDVVANGVAEFNFADFNGEFEIVLTNITTKGTAGEKTYQFFVGDYITEEATVVVE